MKLTSTQEERLARIRSAKDRDYWRDNLIRLGGHRRGEFYRRYIERPWGNPIPLRFVVGSEVRIVRCQTREALERVIQWLGGDPLEPHADHADWADWGWMADDAWSRPGLSMILTVPQATEFRLRFADDDEVRFEVGDEP